MAAKPLRRGHRRKKKKAQAKGAKTKKPHNSGPVTTYPYQEDRVPRADTQSLTQREKNKAFNK